MQRIKLLKISWIFFVLGFLTSIFLILYTIRINSYIGLGAIVFFSIMFLAGFVGICINNKQ